MVGMVVDCVDGTVVVVENWALGDGRDDGPSWA
jgi:hypothetical protein